MLATLIQNADACRVLDAWKCECGIFGVNLSNANAFRAPEDCHKDQPECAMEISALLAFELHLGAALKQNFLKYGPIKSCENPMEISGFHSFFF